MTKGTTGNRESPLAISWCSPSSSSGRRGGCVPLSPASLWGQRPQPADTSSWEAALGGLKSQLGGGHGEGTGGPGDKGNLGTPRGCSARSVHPGCPGGCRAVGGGGEENTKHKEGQRFLGTSPARGSGDRRCRGQQSPSELWGNEGLGEPWGRAGGQTGEQGVPTPPALTCWSYRPEWSRPEEPQRTCWCGGARRRHGLCSRPWGGHRDTAVTFGRVSQRPPVQRFDSPIHSLGERRDHVLSAELRGKETMLSSEGPPDPTPPFSSPPTLILVPFLPSQCLLSSLW